MFIVYFLEGLIIGSLLGLLLRPILDYYVVWRAAKQYEQDDAAEQARERLRRSSR